MTTKERRAREKLARRQAILAAAKAVFAEKALSATTIDEIAERAELAKGTIYLYFKSKEEMYTALMEDGLALLVQRFSRWSTGRFRPTKTFGGFLMRTIVSIARSLSTSGCSSSAGTRTSGRKLALIRPNSKPRPA